MEEQDGPGAAGVSGVELEVDTLFDAIQTVTSAPSDCFATICGD